MSEPRTVTASLEGMRIVAEETQCQLEEYDFSVNQWRRRSTAARPLARLEAELWVEGWNPVDRSEALNLLTQEIDKTEVPDRCPRRAPASSPRPA